MSPSLRMIGLITALVILQVFVPSFILFSNYYDLHRAHAQNTPLGNNFLPPISLTKLRLTDPTVSESQFLIHVNVNNTQEVVQPYNLVVEARNSDRITVALEIVSGELGKSEQRNVSALWTPESAGKYTIRVFAIDGFDDPSILSSMTTKNIITIGQSHCDESLWKHVYYPPRLKIVDECISVTGIVTYNNYISRDGDQHVGVRLDPEFAHLLTQGNIDHHSGALVTESVCEHPTSDKNAARACMNFEHHVDLPPRGAHVRVTGTYVIDTQHNNWAEIHPVTSITVLGTYSVTTTEQP